MFCAVIEPATAQLSERHPSDAAGNTSLPHGQHQCSRNVRRTQTRAHTHITSGDIRRSGRGQPAQAQESSQPTFIPQLQCPSHEDVQPSHEPVQPALHEPQFSCRRSRAPSAPPVIADSFDERDEVLLSQGSPQPSTAESVIARWTSIANRGPCIDLSNA